MESEADPARDRLLDAREAPEQSGYGATDESESLLRPASPSARISPSYTARLNSIIEKQAANLKVPLLHVTVFVDG